MARDQSGSAHPSPEDRNASARAGRKRLGANGYPQAAPDEGRNATEQSSEPKTPEPDRAAVEGGADEA